VLALADKGIVGALRADPHLMAGLNVHEGKITHSAVAEALGAKHVEATCAIEG
jgi:alanine dehydrogenase